MPITPSKFIEAVRRSLPILKNLPPDLDEILERMLTPQGSEIDRERFNIVLSTWKIEPVNRHFFAFYFSESISSTDDFLSGAHRFMRDALWHFGDIRRGFAVLSKIDDINAYIKKHQFDLDEFKNRLPWALVADIRPLDRGFLGYVSGQRPYSEKEVLTITEKILKFLEEHEKELKGLNPDELKARLIEKITPQEMERASQFQTISECEAVDLWSLTEIIENRKTVTKVQNKIEKTIQKVEELKKIGLSNQLHYLRNIEMIDVYVATSMRDDREYLDMARFVQDVFQDKLISSLNLRYFDPTLCYCD